MVSLRDLIKERVHFCHRTIRWCPKMAPYIWGHKNNVHLINISKTATLLEHAAHFLESVAASGKLILWVGTKKAAQACIKDVAEEHNYSYVVHRWIGGTLTNYSQVKKSVTKLLHLEDTIEKSDQFSYTKKELNKFQKNVDRLRSNIGGISNMKWPIGAMVVVDIKKEHSAVCEALRLNIPIVALVDTNSDPTGIDYVIPANDDAVSSITFIINYLKDAVAEGQRKAKKRKEESTEEVTKKAEISSEKPSKKSLEKSTKKVEEPAKKVEELSKSKTTANKKSITKPTKSPTKKTASKKTDKTKTAE